MGKFDGILLCTDLDDTLLTDDKRVSEKNAAALRHFMDEGGKFTFATGRVPHGASLMLGYITPNAPMVCFNGGAIYDCAAERYLWQAELGMDALRAAEFIDKAMPSVGIEVCTDDKIFFCRTNEVVEEHKRMENFPDNYLDYHLIPAPWRKVMFITDEENIPALRKIINESEFYDKFSFVQSSPWYYELLPKGAEKGPGMLRLADMLGIDRKRTIGMGDNENDITLVRDAGIGVAVANASELVKSAASVIAPDNNSDAVAAVIKMLENGEISF